MHVDDHRVAVLTAAVLAVDRSLPWRLLILQRRGLQLSGAEVLYLPRWNRHCEECKGTRSVTLLVQRRWVPGPDLADHCL
mgnify:CR=1 FL=1